MFLDAVSTNIWLCSCEVTKPKEKCFGCYSIRIIKTGMAAGLRNVTRNVYSWVDKHFSVYTGMQREESCLANQTSLFFCFFCFFRPHNYWSVPGETRQLSETQAAAGWSHCHSFNAVNRAAVRFHVVFRCGTYGNTDLLHEPYKQHVSASIQ